jgi:hypothetical protein
MLMTISNVSNKEYVELLRQFYGTYGVANEGPPIEFDATIFPSRMSVSRQDLEDLRVVLQDQALRREFSVCRDILDDLANRLTTTELLREISEIPRTHEDSFDDAVNGIFWFSLAASLDKRRDGLPITPLKNDIDLPIPLKVRMTMVGSLVLRLYVALVYMREGPLSEIINRGAKAGKPCCGRVRKLLNGDYVRRIRNSLSHGSFSMSIAGITFREDEGRIMVATPGFLNWLCTWLMLIQLQALPQQ